MPVDGVVIEGSTEVDESMLTGEALPVVKGEGDAVTGGSQNTTGSVTVRALRVGADSTLARIVRAVEDAQGSKAPIQRIADKIASIFVPAILIIALCVFCIWFFFVEPDVASHRLQQALMPAIAVICVACPCALGLATPTALMVGMGKGAQLGILIKDGSVLEMLVKLSAMVFDKTGTITRGEPTVVTCDVADEVLAMAAAVESKSEHPLARAVVSYAAMRGIGDLPEVTDFKAVIGEGVRGKVDGHDVFVGTSVAPEGAGSGVLVSVDDEPMGYIQFKDEPKPDAASTVHALMKDFDIASYMVTGDNEKTARLVASEVGIADAHVFAGVKPLEKADRVLEVKSAEDVRMLEAASKKAQDAEAKNIVAFVGDGINDAPALAAADVGIAMASGTDVALDAGSVVLMRNRLSDLVVALRLSKATMRKIRQNLFWALIYNCIMIPLAAVGILAPALAGAAMALSSVSVVCNSLLLKRFR